MTLANMRSLGVGRLAVHCLSPRCWHEAIIDASAYDGALPVKSFEPRMVCTCCGMIGAEVRPNWQDQPKRETMVGSAWR